MDQDFNKQDSMSEVILSRKNGLGVKYIAKMETGAVEDHYLKPSNSPFLVWPIDRTKKKNYSWQYSEQMRLLYVAMTRAEKALSCR